MNEENIRIKYICPYCKTSRIVRKNRIILVSNPNFLITLTCRKCKKKECNRYLYLDGIRFLLPIEENNCERCFKKENPLYIIAVTDDHLSLGCIVCKNCFGIALKDYNFVDKKIKIYNK